MFPLQNFDYENSFIKKLFDEHDELEVCGFFTESKALSPGGVFELVKEVISSDQNIARDSLICLKLNEISWVYEDVKNIPENEIPITALEQYYSEFTALLGEVQFIYDNISLLIAKSGSYKIIDVSLECLGANNLCLGVEF